MEARLKVFQSWWLTFSGKYSLLRMLPVDIRNPNVHHEVQDHQLPTDLRLTRCGRHDTRLESVLFHWRASLSQFAPKIVREIKIIDYNDVTLTVSAKFCTKYDLHTSNQIWEMFVITDRRENIEEKSESLEKLLKSFPSFDFL